MGRPESTLPVLDLARCHPPRASRSALVLLLAIGFATAPAPARLASSLQWFDGTDASSLPGLLSKTGLYSSLAERPLRTTTGIIPFAVNAPLWSDGSAKERFIAPPEGATIGAGTAGDFAFPDGVVMIKNFLIDTVVGDPRSRILAETRFLVHRRSPAGPEWHGVTYRWRRDQSEAERVDGDSGLDWVHDVRLNGARVGKRWRYPSSMDCLECHKGRGFLGFTPVQLDRPSAADPSRNQLAVLAAQGVFASAPAYGGFRWAGLSEPGASLEARARSYLAANCSHCHGNGQPMGPSHDFDYPGPAKPIRHDIDPAGGYVGKPGVLLPSLLYPGYPDSSEIMVRMGVRETATGARLQMPPLATAQIDSAALSVLAKWACFLGKRDTQPESCRPPRGQPDHSFWDPPTALHPLGPAPGHRPSGPMRHGPGLLAAPGPASGNTRYFNLLGRFQPSSPLLGGDPLNP